MPLPDRDDLRDERASTGPALRPHSALELAFRLLDEHRATQGWVQERLHAAFTGWNWPGAQRGRVTDLVCGVVRRQGTLNRLLQRVVSRPLEMLEPSLQTLLSLGAYQLAYLDHVPAYAAVNEAVELTKTLGAPRWTKLVNGVLRSIGRLCLEAAASGPAVDALPLSSGRYRQLSEPVFVDPRHAPGEYLAQAFSLPGWLTERWAQRWTGETLWNLGQALNTPPVTFLRVNQLRTTLEQVLAAFSEAGVVAHVVPGHPLALRLEAGPAIPQLPGFAEGWWTPQDLTAMQAAPRLAPATGSRVWDMCAAPGTKTTHLAELMHDDGEILATDRDAERLFRIDDNAKRLGLRSIRSRFINEDPTTLPTGLFDHILLDVPCSNTGVLHRRAEARWRLEPRALFDLPLEQSALLTAAWSRLRPGGTLLYSTCSIEPEENERIVEAFAAHQGDLTVRAQASFLPSEHGDGGFQALLEKRRS